jgi:hypothetical protein
MKYTSVVPQILNSTVKHHKLLQIIVVKYQPSTSFYAFIFSQTLHKRELRAPGCPFYIINVIVRNIDPCNN